MRSPQLDGEDATGAQKSAFQLMQDFLNLLIDPSADGRAAARAGKASRLCRCRSSRACRRTSRSLMRDALRQKPQPGAQPQSFDQRWSAWGSGFGGSGTTDGNATAGSNNVTATDYGYAAGLTYHLTPGTDYGFALAGGGTNWNLAQSLGSGRSDSFQAGVYGTTHFGAAYLSGALAFANHWFTHQPHRARRRSHREIPGPELCRARRGWLSLRPASHRVHHRRHALCGGAGAGLPYAELQRNRFDRRRLRSDLRCGERHGYAQRTRRALRQSHRAGTACRWFYAAVSPGRMTG